MKKFKKVYIEITNVCNLSCSFCPKTKREYKYLSVEDFKHTLEQVKPYTDYIYFHLMGEPLLNPNLEKFLDLAYENNLKVNITTNGTLLPKVKNILINSKALRQVNISLHSFEANNNVNFYEYINNVLEFCNESSCIRSLRLWNLDSYNLKGDNKLNKDIIDILKNNFNYEGDLKADLDMKKGLKIGNKVYLNSAEKFQWPTMDIDIISEEGFCYGIRDHIGILVDGTVVPCCLDGEGNIPLGNIHKDTLENILNSERAMAIYNGFSNRKRVEELCKRCGYSQRF